MNHKVNLQARIRRHSRILKDNLGHTLYHSGKGTLGYRIVAFLIILLFPVYPAFASLVYSNTQLDFYRGDIDESSILSSYEEDKNLSDEDMLFESKDSYLSVGALVDDDLSQTNTIVTHTVEPDETIAFIAKKYDISEDTILWANDFEKGHVVNPGDVLEFPPVSGLIYKVKRGETISGIATKYQVSSESIRKQNLLSDNIINPGQKLILPGAIYIEEKVEPVLAAAPQQTSKKNVSASAPKKSTASSAAQSSSVAQAGSYTLTKKPSYHTFYWGNCTWYVAKYKTVDWGGNANQWLYNAAAKGHATGKTPTVGSIIVFNGRGYNPRYGHVGIVMEVKSDHIIVSDMNYRKLGEVTYRKVSKNDGAIRGYIYVD